MLDDSSRLERRNRRQDQRYFDWLYGQLPSLVEQEVLSEETAFRLREYYQRLSEAKAGESKRLLVLLFAILGAVSIGTGIILLVAHNWDEFGRPARVFWSFTPLVASQAICAFAALSRPRSQAWREAGASLSMLSIAACISLISQTYNIQGTMGGFVLTCMLLSLPAVYLMDSRIAALLYLGGTTWVAGLDFYGIQDGLLFWPLLFLVSPYLLYQIVRRPEEQRTRCLHATVAMCIPIGSAFMVFDLLDGGLSFLFYAALFGAMVATASLRLARLGFPRFAPFPTVGALGAAVLTYLMTFRPTWEELVNGRGPEGWGVVLVLVGIGLAMAAVARATCSLVRHDWPQAALAFAPAVALLGFSLAHNQPGLLFATALCNLYGLALGLCFLLPGISAGRLLQTNQGLLWISALFVARFFDADMSFVVRGIGFIAVGAAFLVTNLMVVHRRRQFV